MRIMMLAQNYPPTTGGEETHVRSLSVELARRGHAVSVVSLRDGHSPDVVEDEGVRVYRIGGALQRLPGLFSTGRRFAPPLPDPESMLALRRILTREQPDIMHAHNWMIYNALPLKALTGARLVLTLHDYGFACPQKRLMYHNRVVCDGPQLKKCLDCAATYYGSAKGAFTTLTHWAMGPIERRAVDMFLPVSQAIADGNGLTGSGLPYQVVPNFVRDEPEPLRPEHAHLLDQLPQGDFLLFVGDLSRDKGVHALLEAVSGIDSCPPVVLIGRVVQDTPTEVPPNVTILPGWPHDAVMEAWRRSALAVVPSICAEAFGIVLIEAMQAGRPAVVSQVGGLPDVVADGETGILAPPGNVAALRAGIARLVNDPALRAEMGRAARERVAMFQASTVLPRIEAVYRELCEAPTIAPMPAANRGDLVTSGTQASS